MNISVNSGNIPQEIKNINYSKKILIIGEAASDSKARDIICPINKEEALSLYGNSELYDAYCLLLDLGVERVYTANCFYESDYIRITDKLLHYDFDYLVPIGIYLSDKFYNPITNKDDYYISYILEQLATVNSLTTVITTERHASLYEDFDHYTLEMATKEIDFFNYHSLEKMTLLENYGNNLNFVYNNLRSIPYSNVILGALYCTRDYANYFNSLSNIEVEFDINNIDIYGLKAMYFKFNYYTKNITIENSFNFKKANDIYCNALIDDVIKRTIKSIDLSNYKGSLFNPYVSIQIENEMTKKLKNLKGKLFKSFSINKIAFKKTDPSSGYIVVDYSIVPFGTLEGINIIMGVV